MQCGWFDTHYLCTVLILSWPQRLLFLSITIHFSNKFNTRAFTICCRLFDHFPSHRDKRTNLCDVNNKQTIIKEFISRRDALLSNAIEMRCGHSIWISDLTWSFYWFCTQFGSINHFRGFHLGSALSSSLLCRFANLGFATEPER